MLMRVIHISMWLMATGFALSEFIIKQSKLQTLSLSLSLSLSLILFRRFKPLKELTGLRMCFNICGPKSYSLNYLNLSLTICNLFIF